MSTVEIDCYVNGLEAEYAKISPEERLLEIGRILNSSVKPLAKLVAIAIVTNSHS